MAYAHSYILYAKSDVFYYVWMWFLVVYRDRTRSDHQGAFFESVTPSNVVCYRAYGVCVLFVTSNILCTALHYSALHSSAMVSAQCNLYAMLMLHRLCSMEIICLRMWNVTG